MDKTQQGNNKPRKNRDRQRRGRLQKNIMKVKNLGYISNFQDEQAVT